ncbi:MAG: GNAT family N-acetyltransferase [Planctomycetes bacterium]|nr:GNAT family N-acetyltransferase [Planctomycetota bacterium]
MQMNDLVLRLVPEGELEVAASLLPSETDRTDPRSECFGDLPKAPLSTGEKIWGIDNHGTLTGVIYLLPQPEEKVVHVKAIALPRGRWGMGLATWMLEEAYKIVKRGKFDEMRITLESGTPAIGEAIMDAEFKGPDLTEETFPVGNLIREVVRP